MEEEERDEINTGRAKSMNSLLTSDNRRTDLGREGILMIHTQHNTPCPSPWFVGVKGGLPDLVEKSFFPSSLLLTEDISRRSLSS